MSSKCPYVTNRAPPSKSLPILAASTNPAAKSSPYYVDPATMSPLQRHCAFFDRDGDGLILPWETFAGMRAIGYGLVAALTGTFLVHFFFSWWTLDSWIPDPFFAIVLRNVHRLKHGSDMQVYGHDGQIRGNPVQEEMTRPEDARASEAQGPMASSLVSLRSFDVDHKGGLNLADIVGMTQWSWDRLDFFGWWASKFEWLFLWLLCQQGGIVPWNDVDEQYDGGLFHRLERERMGYRE